MLDDINLGKHIQLLDICLNREDQPFPGHFVSARSHKHFIATIPHELSFKDGWDGKGIFVGKVFNMIWWVRSISSKAVVLALAPVIIVTHWSHAL